VMLGTNALFRALGFHTSETDTAFVLGGAVTGSVLVLVGLVIVYSGGVSWLVGAQAERWTDDILRGLGPPWKIVHNVEFVAGDPPDTWTVDVDHIAVGPDRVLVIETKYSSDPVDLDAEKLAPRVRKAVNQVAWNAQRVPKLLADTSAPPLVVPLVIYWGYRVTVPNEAVRFVGRNRVVMGADADRWLPDVLGGKHQVDSQALDEAWRCVERHVAASTSRISD